jgi:signal transduction histidine kinase
MDFPSRRRSLGWPIALGVVMIVLLVALTVGWLLLPTIGEGWNPGAYWTIVILGVTFLVLVLVGVVLYLALTIKAFRLNQRQSNFVDSVTHELKSPIASLKLYLQTLSRRQVTEEEAAGFYRFMLDDLERLDTLINHMLDAARLDQRPADSELTDVDLAPLITSAAQSACRRYHLPEDTVVLEVEPAIVRARSIDLDMVFRNLIDNAIKYSGSPPDVRVRVRFTRPGIVTVSISDNGPGIPTKLRRKIFGRFVRLGSELERKKPGTGLGLFIVRTQVKRLKGKIQVHPAADGAGTVFDVELPARALEARTVEAQGMESLYSESERNESKRNETERNETERSSNPEAPASQLPSLAGRGGQEEGRSVEP